MERLRFEDAAAAASLSAGFGWPHRAEDWAMFLRLGHGIAARAQGRLVGTAMWFPLGAGRASIGLVQVAPDQQGRGLGRTLMRAVIDAAAAPNLVLHATAEGASLYRSLGFEPGATVEQWQGECTAASQAGPTRPGSQADEPALLALDVAATGLSRPAVMRSWMATAETVVLGPLGEPFAMAMRGRFGRGALLGPVTAPDPDAAEQLVRALLRPGFVRLDLLDPAEPMRNRLRAAGLACVGTVRRMTGGCWPAPTGPARPIALLSQALG